MRRIVGLGLTQCFMQYTLSVNTEDIGFLREHLSNLYHYIICTMCYEEQIVNLLLQVDSAANEL